MRYIRIVKVHFHHLVPKHYCHLHHKKQILPSMPTPPLLGMLMVRIRHEHTAEIEGQILMAAVLPVADRASIPTNSDPRKTDSAKWH